MIVIPRILCGKITGESTRMMQQAGRWYGSPYNRGAIQAMTQ